MQELERARACDDYVGWERFLFERREHSDMAFVLDLKEVDQGG